jgi:energy-coupling factor transport system substrate-specific component
MEIPEEARIIAVADAYDAMRSDRIYRKGLRVDIIREELVKGRGTQFDPDALDAFVRLVDKKIINLPELYAHRRAEIEHADQKAQAELRRRVEEDKKIQKAEMDDGADGKGA